jgi:hypothetical protein
VETRSLGRSGRAALGVAIAAGVLLVYGLFRPDSLMFSIAFLISPSLALMWTAERPTGADRRAVVWVTWGTVVAMAGVVAIDWLRS